MPSTSRHSDRSNHSASRSAPQRQTPAPSSAAVTATAMQHAAASPSQASPQEILALQAAYGNQAVQRLVQSDAQRSAPVGLEGGDVDQSLAGEIQTQRGAGSPLPGSVGDKMGRAFGADFSGVRVHTGGSSDRLSRSLSASAFTVGSDIFFSHGSYAPGDSHGQKLIAHELTHVVQQNPGVRRSPSGLSRAKPNKAQTKLTVGPAGDRYEQEADRMAAAVVQRISTPQPVSGEPAPDDTLQAKYRDPSSNRVSRQFDMDPLSVDAVAPMSIQRAVGFEFQTGWGITRSVPDPNAAPMSNGKKFVRGVKKFFKGAESVVDQQDWGAGQVPNKVAMPDPGKQHVPLPKATIVKDYGPFKLTVDDSSNPLGGEIEWVIDPPIQESNDANAVGMVMNAMMRELNRLLAFSGRKRFFLNEVTGTPTDEQFEIQPGIKGADSRNMQANVQTTGGVSMDKLFTMFKEMGTGAHQNVKNRIGGTPELSGTGQGVAGQAHAVGTRVAGSEALKGLVSFIFRYLQMGKKLPNYTGKSPQQHAYDTSLNYAKAGTLFLARTDFAKMFKMLPDDEQTRFREDPNSFVALVQDAVGGDLDFSQEVLERGIKGNAATLEVKRIEVSRRDWIYNIALGQDWMGVKSHVAQAEGYDTELESMGSLGGKTDRVGNDPGGNKDAWKGVVLEFRGKVDPIPPSAWKPYVLTSFKYIKDLNSNNARV